MTAVQQKGFVCGVQRTFHQCHQKNQTNFTNPHNSLITGVTNTSPGITCYWASGTVILNYQNKTENTYEPLANADTFQY